MDGSNERFSWVYDCGSKRSQPLQAALSALSTWPQWQQRIDLVVISHFDDDHVNGLESLLKQSKVNYLVLPFSDWPQQVREVAVGGANGITASTAYLQLDPRGWLAARNLTERVQTILLVRGGATDGNEGPLDPIILPRGPNTETGPETISRITTIVDSLSDLTSSKSGRTGQPSTQVVTHGNPLLIAGLPMEFMFYNAELDASALGIIESTGSGLVAKKSRMPLDDVKTAINATISALGFDKPLTKLPPDWRVQLKNAYQYHFGSTSKAKNNISLCLYVRPVAPLGTVQPCAIFEGHRLEDATDDDGKNLRVDDARPAVLCTGDLTLDINVICAMKAHFGNHRWQEIGITQVPHHGSTHSWTNGNAALLAPSSFVHCAPGSIAHPHAIVRADLTGHQVFTADYERPVTLTYHF